MSSIISAIRSSKALRIIAVLAMVLGLLGPIAQVTPVHADQPAPSGTDVTVNGSGTVATLNFGSVCARTTVTKDITVAVNRQGQGSNVFPNGATVAVSVGPVTGTGYSATVGTPSTVTLPSDWSSKSNGTLSSASAKVTGTLLAGSSGSPTGSFTITLSDGTVSLQTAVTLNATIVTAGCDTTPPTLSLPSNMTIEATSASGAVVTYTATATDTNPANPAVTCAPTSGSTFPLGTTTVNCSATDAANNTANGSFTVTVRDTTGPVISGTPSNMTVPAVNSQGATVTYTNPTATDAVDGTRPVSCAPASGSIFGLGQTTVTCTSADTRSNTSTSQFTVDVKDQAAPVLQLPGAITAEATSAQGAVVTYSASAVDNVDGPRPVTCSPASGSTFPLGTTTVTCSATDSANNTNSGSFFVTVQDTTPPAVTVPAAITSEATGPGGATVNFAASATDRVDGSITPTCSPASGSTFPLGISTVTCSAVDAHGNSGSNSFTVNVRDTTAPVLHLPADQTLEAISPAGALASFSATAEDTVDGAVNVDCSANPGTFPLGTTVVNCSAKDAHGNKAQGSFSIIVQDTIAPELTVPANMTLEATGPNGAAATYEATATDTAVQGPITPQCAPASGAVFALDATTTVSCSASDGHGNTTTHTFTVTVQDKTAPDIASSLTGIVPVEVLGGANVTYDLPATTDLVDGAITPSCSPASGSLFPLGTNTVTCTATDAHGNSATGTYTILVQDSTAPVLSLPSNITLEATGASGAVATFTATADDTVSGPVTPSCSPASGSTFALGTNTVSCTATDPSNNTSRGTFSVIVADTTPPRLTLPAPITAEATGPTGAAVHYSAFAADTVDGAVEVTCDKVSDSTFALGVTSVNCSATDAHGNKAQDSFTVNVQDTTPPALTLPGNITAEADSTSGATVTYTSPTAVDLVDGPVTVNCEVASGSVFGPGVTTVGCSATDSQGNTAHGSFAVTVVDTTPPKITLPQDIVAEATGPDGAPVSYETSAYDILDGSVEVTCGPTSGSTFALGDTTVECSAKDAHNNSASATFNVTVRDTTPPDINGQLADITAEAASGSGAIVSYTSPSGHDIVDGNVPVTCTPDSGSTFPLGDNTVTCTAVDSHNNTGTRTFKVRVQDTTAPVLTLPGDLTAEATSGAGAVVTYQPTANDAVDGPSPVGCNPSSGSTFPLGPSTVNCSSTDAHDNTAWGSFTVTIVDTTPPVLSVPGNKTVEATGPNGATVTYDAATATDLVDGAVTPACDKASNTIFGLGETTVTCTATDSHHNAVSDSFVVNVVDTTAPSLSQPENVTAEATGPGGASVTYTAPTATDLVDGTDAVTCEPASGAQFSLGDTTVTCSAADARGNSASVSFGVTVRDTTAPDLTVPHDLTLEATGPDGAAGTYIATANDLVDGPLGPTCSPASGSTFALGATTVSCSIKDAHGNEATGSFHVTVQDTTPPDIQGDVQNIHAVEALGGATVTYDAPTAQDAVDGSRPVTCTPVSGTLFPIGEDPVECRTTDSHGNTATRTFEIDVKDLNAPVLTVPADFTEEATGPQGAAVSYQASAYDTVDGPRPVTCIPASGSTFPLGDTTVTCSATDTAGNANSKSFTITVADTTKPTLSQVSDITAEATGASGAAVTYTAPTATDLVDGTRPVSCDHASGSTFPLGDTTVTCSAADTHGNTGTTTFKVTIVDTTAPAVTVPANITRTATSAGGATVTYGASANDIVDGPRPVTCSPASGSLFAPGATTVTCSATDSHGNTGTETFTVTVTFSWSGVLPPVSPDGNSVFKLGSTIPVKFTLTEASSNITNAAVRLYVVKLNNSVPQGAEQEATSTSAANVGNYFRYDASGHQYIFNLGTKGLSAGTWQMRFDFGDRVPRTVNFSLRP